MRSFAVELLTGEALERILGVTSLVAEDASGSFGIQAGHERFTTVLEPGLVRLATADGGRVFLAVPGGILAVVDGTVRLIARRCLRGGEPLELARRLADELAREAGARAERRRRLERLEAELFRRLVEGERGRVA